MERKLYLIYVYKIGVNKSRENIYELIFTDDIIDATGIGWESSPAFMHSELPKAKYITKKVRVEADLDLICLTSEDDEDKTYGFSMADAMDGAIALAWEREYRKDVGRLVLKYGALYEELKYVLGELEIELKEQ